MIRQLEERTVKTCHSKTNVAIVVGRLLRVFCFSLIHV